MTLAIITLKHVFPLHTETQNYHLKVSQCATLPIIMQTFFHLIKLLMLTNEIRLTISRRDNSDLQASNLGPSQTMYMTLNTLNNTLNKFNQCLIIFNVVTTPTLLNTNFQFFDSQCQKTCQMISRILLLSFVLFLHINTNTKFKQVTSTHYHS